MDQKCGNFRHETGRQERGREGGKKRPRERGADLTVTEHLRNDTHSCRYVLTFSDLNPVTNLWSSHYLYLKDEETEV